MKKRKPPKLGKLPSASKTGEVSHCRSVDTLALLLKRKKIGLPAHDAGRRFAEDFAASGFEGMRAINYASTGASGEGYSATEKTALARRRVHRALDAVGGMGSAGGRIVWEALGMGVPVKQCARNLDFNCQETMGMFMALLTVLSAHYGYERRLFYEKRLDAK